MLRLLLCEIVAFCYQHQHIHSGVGNKVPQLQTTKVRAQKAQTGDLENRICYVRLQQNPADMSRLRIVVLSTAKGPQVFLSLLGEEHH